MLDFDADSSSTIVHKEVLKMMMHRLLHRDPKSEILMDFLLFDDGETGKMSVKNLK